MCFGGGSSVPDTASQARQDEEKRQANIAAGTQTVNQNFEKFTPDYYSKIGQAYSDYYRPQVDKAGREARRATTLRFGDNPNSSAANRVQGNLESDYATKVGEIGAGAIDTGNQARQQVEAQRGHMLDLVNAGSGLDSVAAQSANFASAYNPPTAYSPLGDLFSKYTNTLGNAALASNQGYQAPAFWQKQVDFLRGSGAGSSRNVGGS